MFSLVSFAVICTLRAGKDPGVHLLLSQKKAQVSQNKETTPEQNKIRNDSSPLTEIKHQDKNEILSRLEEGQRSAALL